MTENTVDVQWLADRIAIQDVIALYSLGQDSHQGPTTGTLDQWDQAFAPDATVDYTAAGAPPNISYRELALIMRGETGTEGQQPQAYSNWQHMLSLPVVTIEGDTAQGRTDFQALHKVKTEGPAGIRLDATGAFHDSLVRTSAGWRIKHRRLELYFVDSIETLSVSAAGEGLLES
jgi:SnoaL-like domain